MEYFTNICGKCHKEFRTNVRARGYCYLCNPFSVSFKGEQQPIFTSFADSEVTPDEPVIPEVPETPEVPEIPEVPEEIVPFGTIETLTTGGVVNENDVSFRTALTINYSPEADLEGSTHRNPGWYVGVKVIAPNEYASNATYKTRTPRLDPANPAHEWDTIEAHNFNEYKDGDNFIGFWPILLPDFVDNYVNVGLDIVYEFIADWNGDGEYEQTFTITIDPTQVILKSEDGTTVIYPVSEENGEVMGE